MFQILFAANELLSHQSDSGSKTAEFTSLNQVRINELLKADSSASYFDHEMSSIDKLVIIGSKAYYADDAKNIKRPHINIPAYYSSDSKGIFPLVLHS